MSSLFSLESEHLFLSIILAEFVYSLEVTKFRSVGSARCIMFPMMIWSYSEVNPGRWRFLGRVTPCQRVSNVPPTTPVWDFVNLRHVFTRLSTSQFSHCGPDSDFSFAAAVPGAVRIEVLKLFLKTKITVLPMYVVSITAFSYDTKTRRDSDGSALVV